MNNGPNLPHESIDNEQLRRLKAAGWNCSWQFYTEIHLDDHANIHQFHVCAEKNNEKIVVYSTHAEQSRAWEHLCSEAKRVDPTLRVTGDE